MKLPGQGEATGPDGGDRAGGAVPIVGAPLTLAQVLELVDYGPDERLSVLVIAAGQTDADRRTGLYRPAELVELAGDLERGANLWHSLSTFGPAATGRGKTADVDRIPAVWADLDVVESAPHLKAQAVPTWALAWELVGALSELLGTAPAYVTMTGHGLQPAWLLEPEDSANVAAATAALRRFGLLVRHVARLRGCSVDSVWDPARVLRAAGSVNWKDPAAPVAVVAHPTGGARLSLAELAECFEAYDVPHVRADEAAGEPVPAASWRWAGRTCGYVAAMIGNWSKDTPGARHPWLTSAAVRLTAAHRAGCLTEAGWHGAVAELEDRMRVLCKPDPLATGKVRQAQEQRLARVGDELRNSGHGALAWARTRVEGWSDERLADEFAKCRGCQTRRALNEWVPGSGVTA